MKRQHDLVFVVQKHAATHLHYDFRLELDGVLKSWAIPKGPSLDPSIKRLAMHVEDHPFEYKDFEGVIPPGNYGAGRVIIWDQGTYHAAGAEGTEESLREGYRKGDLKFVLNGTKLKGEFALVRLKTADEKSWLLIKKKDRFATTEEITGDDRSVVTGAPLKDTERRDSKPRSAPTAPTARSDSAPPLPLPRNVEPMYATAVKEPFSDPRWLFELKLDGYRTIAQVEKGAVSLYSRKGISFDRLFAPIVSSLTRFGHDAVLDGEVVVLDEQGKSSFQLLQNYQRTGTGNLCYFVFDLLYLDGENLCDLPLAARKQMLKTCLTERPNVRFSDHIAEDGIAFFELASKSGLEGIVAKRNDSRYLPGRRTREWLKIKITQQQEAVVCGFTDPRKSRKFFRSLVLGVYQDRELTYIGLCGGGFDEPTLKDLYNRLQPLIQEECPFKQVPPTGMPVTWVRPVLVCEVKFAEWTEEQIMRQPVFLGLREDKDPESVVRETAIEAKEALQASRIQPEKVRPQEPEETKKLVGKKPELPSREGDFDVGGRKLRLSNLDKVFWPEQGYSKRDVVEYYLRVAPFILPHLKDRPQSLYRTPEGMAGEGFFQKEAGDLPREWIGTKEIYSRSQGKTIKFFLCQDEATLIFMANLGCVEINPWLSRVPSLDHPDYVVIDLDPEAIGYEEVVEAALAVRQVLDKAGAAGFPKTSGSRGMHIYIPLAARYDYDTAGKFAELVANLAHRLVPAFTSLVRSPGKRQHKVYFDYLQNRRGQTIAAPYSLRVRAGATVSTPLSWDEVKPGLDPRAFTIKTVCERLEELGDLFQGALGPGLDLEQALARLQK